MCAGWRLWRRDSLYPILRHHRPLYPPTQIVNGGMVPRARAEAAEADVERMRLQLDGMVPRARAEAAEAEAERLRGLMDGMVPRARAEEAEAEAERARRQLQGMVSRGELAAAQVSAAGGSAGSCLYRSWR